MGREIRLLFLSHPVLRAAYASALGRRSQEGKGGLVVVYKGIRHVDAINKMPQVKPDLVRSDDDWEVEHGAVNRCPPEMAEKK